MTDDTAQPRTDGRRIEYGWPTQLLLPGQAAAPEGPVDMSMMYLMHFGFRRDLTAFAAAAAATRSPTGTLGPRWPSAGRCSRRSSITTTAVRTPASGPC